MMQTYIFYLILPSNLIELFKKCVLKVLEEYKLFCKFASETYSWGL